MLFQQLLWAPLSQSTHLYAQEGGVVVGGTASIVQSGTTLDINTQTARTVINWNSFNIDASHTMNFNQPGINSAVLNRVVTPNNPSAIFGNLNSNGNVYLVNPSGVIVGSSGMINTNGFTASVLDISTNEFMQGGVLNFRGDSNASIINQGKIYTGTGGTTLIGGTVINEGLIESNGGSINLLTGGSVTLKGGGVYTQADQATLLNGISETSGLIKNSGTLRATGSLEVGGEVYLVSPRGTVIQEAIVAASKKEAGGNVVVDAGKGNATVSGSIDVQGKTGGTVTVTGQQVELQNAMIDASGENGGGTINIGGGFQGNDASITNSQSTFINANTLLKVDAGVSGDGGTVIIWSDGATDYFGTVSNRGSQIGAGGFTEVSGTASLNFAGSVNTGGGDLLLEPFTYTINAAAAANILAALGTNNVTIQTTTDVANFGSSGNNADAGDIIVNANIFWDSPNSLTMLAHRDIRFNTSVQNRNDTGGDLNIVAGWDGTTAFNLNDFVTADVINTTLFGNNNGSVFIGDGSQTTGIAVGSRNGNTNVFGYDVNLQAGNWAGSDGRFAQLGFQISNGVALGGFDLDPISINGENVSVDGNITVHSANDVTATAGYFSFHTYAQIGHIGTDQSFDNNVEATASGMIELAVKRDIRFAAEGGFASYSQLGHGGYFALGDHSGDITIAQANNINFRGGSAIFAYVQLGNGGSRADGNHSGNHTIFRANDITFKGGSDNAYTQFGNGGDSAVGNHSGNLAIVQANDITFEDGGFFAYAHLGNGGLGADGNHSGNHTITQANNITFLAGSTGTYAQIGNGTGSNTNGSRSGNIDITLDGDLALSSTYLSSYYAIIGHGDRVGGSDAGETVSGDINLRVGGNATLTNAFVGHLVDNDGTYTSGNTYLGVRGDLNTNAGSQFFSAPPTGNGELRFYVAGNDLVSPATLLNGVAHGGTPFPNDQGNFGFGAGPYSPAVGTNFAYYHQPNNIFNYDVDATDAANILAALAGGDVTLASDLDQSNFGSFFDWDGGTQFININSSLLYDSPNSLTLQATGNVNFNASVQNRNATGGDLNIVAGWDLVTPFDTATFSAADVLNTNLFGNNNGSVFIGNGSQTSGIAVSGRNGNTNVFAYDVNLQAGNGAGSNGRFAQLGFQISDGIALGGFDLDPGSADGANVAVNGNITVHSINDVTAIGGDSSRYNYVQIGHVGADQINDFNVEAVASSIIELAVGRDITFTAGSGQISYAQMGQGGHEAVGNHGGSIMITRANDISFSGGDWVAYAQMGQGGVRANGDLSGDITIKQANNINFSAGYGHFSYSQMGQGGYEAAGNHSGTITIDRANDISFSGGDWIAYSQMGQGGVRSIGDHDGTITITQANNINFMAGDKDFSYVQMGQGGHEAAGTHRGTILVTQAGDITFAAGGGAVSYAQMGQGGYEAAGDHNGSITLKRANDITFSGDGWIAYAQMGQGGVRANGNLAGEITISHANNISFTAGDNDFSYAQMGQGGYDTFGSFSGITDIKPTGNLILNGKDLTDQYALIGHGDNPGDGDVGNTVSGDVTIRVGGNVTVNNGWIGHLLDADGLSNTGNMKLMADGNITLDNLLSSGSYDTASSYSYIAGGNVNFNSSVQNRNATGGDLNIVTGWDGATAFNAGTFAAADVLNTNLFGNNNGSIFIGDGTQARGIVVGSRRGNTNVFAYDVNLQGGNDAGFNRRFAQLGFQITDGIAFGGFDLDPTFRNGANVVVDGDMTVHTINAVTATGGNGSSYNYAQIGHVGADYAFDYVVEAVTGSLIELTAGGNVTFAGGDGAYSYAQLGHGGFYARGNHNGTITITQVQDLIFTGGNGNYAYSQFGQGGWSSAGNFSGTTTITQAHDLIFSGGSGYYSYAQLGHGGFVALGTHSGVTTIVQAHDLIFNGGRGLFAYAQLGQGGRASHGDHSGILTITQAHNLTFTGGRGWRAYAQMGQGGDGSIGLFSGTTMIAKAYDLTFTGGRGRRAYAQLGQGGYKTAASHSGTTMITQANDLIFSGGFGSYAYAQLGQGGFGTSGNHSGTTTIMQANDLIFTGGRGNYSYAQLGQGGLFSYGNYSGTTTITQANDLIFSGGIGSHANAQLGQGGALPNSNSNGTIDVTLDGNLTLTGQDLTDQYVLIGHGDHLGDSDAGNTVRGDINLRVGGSAAFTNAYIGHLIDADGTYISGKTQIAIGTGNFDGGNLTDQLVVDGNSQFFSAPIANGGELRFYLPRESSFQVADGARLNGANVTTFTNGVPNRQGTFQPFNGPYNINPADGNFAFYLAVIELIVNANSGTSIYGDTPINPGLDLFNGILRSGDTLGSIGLTNNFSLTSGSNAGTYALSVDATNLDPGYTLVGSSGGTFTINPAALTITPIDVTKEITNLIVLDGTIGFTTSGLKNSETVNSVTLASMGTPADALVGTYPIFASNPLGSLDVNNYDITFMEGTLTVEPFSALVDVDNLTQDTFSRYQNYFDSADSLVKPTGPGNINWIGLPGGPDEEEEDSSPIEEGTIPFEIRSSSLQASN